MWFKLFDMKKLILASNSPRRSDLLKKSGYKFDIIVSNYEEKSCSLDPIITATTFAFGKAKGVFDRIDNKEQFVVLGADTIVYCENEIIGKPKDDEEAFEIIKKLSGKFHQVITGYSLISTDKINTDYVISNVQFRSLSNDEISSYVKSGLYKGKAGGYGIQDKEFSLVESYSGSLNNIIGLPTEVIKNHLDKML